MDTNVELLGKRQYYKVEISGHGLRYLVMINDILIHKELDPGVKVDVDLPVNHFFKSGENVLSIQVYPEKKGGGFPPAARLSVTLFLTSNDSKTKYDLLDMNFKGETSDVSIEISPNKYDFEQGLKPSSDGEILIGSTVSEDYIEYDGAKTFLRTINLPTSLPMWEFFNSDDLPDFESWDDDKYYAEIDRLLTDVLRKVENALATGKVDGLMPLFEERNREMDQAFYLELGTTESNLKESIIESFNDADLELSRIKDKHTLNFEPFTSNKITSLVRGSSDPAVGFNMKGGGSVNYPIYFRYENGKWIITR